MQIAHSLCAKRYKNVYLNYRIIYSRYGRRKQDGDYESIFGLGRSESIIIRTKQDLSVFRGGLPEAGAIQSDQSREIVQNPSEVIR